MFNEPISSIKGIGQELEAKFKLLGINDIHDLIYNFPKRYEDYSKVANISEIIPGKVTLKGQIKQATGRYVRRGLHITEAILSDDTGSV